MRCIDAGVLSKVLYNDARILLRVQCNDARVLLRVLLEFGIYIGLSSYYECTCLQYCSDMLL